MRIRAKEIAGKMVLMAETGGTEYTAGGDTLGEALVDLAEQIEAEDNILGDR
jgi:hypothetical protein